jgi:iron complex outermembrane recepter protein
MKADRPPGARAPDGPRRPGRHGCRSLGLLVLVGCSQLTAPARADRAGENAVTAAEDAFGTSVGFQTVGLYSPNDARGFNPQQAGNLRIEGLYFDQETWVSPECMVRDSAMRIGIAAQSYSFSSPTGIADLNLHTPGDKAGLSALLYGGTYLESSALVEAQAPITSRLSAEGCAQYVKNFLPDQTRRSEGISLGSTLRWRPAEGTEVVPFWTHVSANEHQILPQVYTDGVQPLPLFTQRGLASQSFTSQGYGMTDLGVIVRQAFDHEWRLTAGLFHSRENDAQADLEEYLSVLPNRTADHVLDVVPPFLATSTSGELRLGRRFVSGANQQKLELAVRGRTVDRDFGGDALIDYGLVTLESGPPAHTPAYATTATSLDQTRQLDAGVMYEDRWSGVGSLGLGLLRSSYRRTVLAPDTAPVTSSATPWLPNARFTIDAGRAFSIYGSYTQGLEDSALAPSSAANRGEPPPATRTHQTDGGLRYAPSKELSLIVGGFEIHKVYFNLDAANIYTALGHVDHRGLETSLTYSGSGLTLVAGGVWLRPRVQRTIPEPGATGDVPLGPVPLVLTTNIDYAPPRWHPWAASLQWNWLSRRVQTADDRYYLPALSTLTAGLRYESKLQGHPCSMRLDIKNLTDARGLHVSQLGLVVPELGRRFLLTLAFDT